MGNGCRKLGHSGNLRCSCKARLSGSQLVFGLFPFIDVNGQTIPLNDASLPIAQRLATSMVPTKLAVRPAQTDHTLIRSPGLNCVIESLCSFWKVGRVHERLPSTMLKILKPHAT